MMDEQSPADSSPSIEERLNAVLNPDSAAPEAAPDDDGEIEQAAEQTGEDPAEQATAAPELVEWQDGDGTTYQVPPQVKEAALRHADYTQKTQQMARLAEAAQDRLHYAEAREHMTAALLADVGRLQAKKSQLEQYRGLDWSAHYASDPGNAMRLRDQRDQLEREVQEEERALQGKAANIQKMTSDHSAKQWGLAIEGVKARIGKVSAEEDAAMLKAVKDLGFTEKELQGRFADARFLHAVYKAAKYDMLQAAKPQSLNAIQKAPPVVKPGAVKGQDAVRAQKYQDARQALRRSGSLQDAARLLAKF